MKRLTTRNYLGYTAGDTANNLAFSMQSMFLMIYYTNAVGLHASAVATMFLIVRIWDGVSDLVAGRLVDITNTRWGRFRPYLIVASLPMLVMTVLLFSVPGFGGDRALQYLWAYISFALFGFFYSLVNIPYGSLAAVMTQDPVERSKLGVWRSVGPQLALIALTVVVSPLKANRSSSPNTAPTPIPGCIPWSPTVPGPRSIRSNTWT
jgi:glucuronide carrier protein